MEEEIFIMISALQHYAFCPRQFALIHVEQAWEENQYTAEGKVLHQRVDSGAAEKRRRLRTERGVLLHSERFHLRGKMDLLEIELCEPMKYFPVEYKRGKPKVSDWDRIQLCAQAICLEEMRSIHIDRGAIWYWEVRKRVPVDLDLALRRTTIETINHARDLLARGFTPPPINDRKRCRKCSLKDLCKPDSFYHDQSESYIASLFSEENIPPEDD